MPNTLHHERVRVPITALAYWQNRLLVGEGPFLRVFVDNRLLLTRRIFDDQSIHGLTVDDEADRSNPSAYDQLLGFVVAWGGFLVRVIRLSVDHAVWFGPLIKAADWILDVAFNQHSDSNYAIAALVTAHNALLELNIASINESDKRCESSLRELTTSSRSILYSAHISWLTRTWVLIASGTAFGEIVIWSYTFDNQKGRTQVHHIFSGHEGSIFGVRISQELGALQDKAPQRLLASCSDDRTIRVWDISDLDRSYARPEHDEDDPMQFESRETGFGSLGPASLEGASTGKSCLAMAWGHASRIWGLRFFDASPDSSAVINIMSFGEDASCQSWDLTTAQDASPKSSQPCRFSLQHVHTWAYHSGKNIWSVASRTVGSRRYITTGAADSKIVTYPTCSTDISSERSIEEVLSASCFGSNSKDAFRCYSFVGEDAFVATTNDGLVLLAEYGASPDAAVSPSNLRWRKLDHQKGLRGYSIAAGVPTVGVVFLAGSRGVVYCYHRATDRISIIGILEGKLAGLFAHELESKSGQQRLCLLVTRLGASVPYSFLVHVSQDGPPTLVRSLALSSEPAIPSHLVITSMLHVSIGHDEETILLGSRGGAVAVLCLSRLSFAELEDEIADTSDVLLAQVIKDVHQKEAVTAMHWMSDKGARSESIGWLFSVGRDGACSVHHSDIHKHIFTLVHKLSLPFGLNIEGLYTDPQTNSLFVYGFHSKQFVLHNATADEDIMRVDCGGAHRNWAFVPLKQTGGGSFIWTQASKLNFHSARRPRHRTIRAGGHGREIKACAISLTQLSGSIGRLIATGAEDTNIRLFAYEGISRRGEDGSLRPLAVVRKHNTGIQCLRWSDDGRYLFSSGGFEEFYVWRIRDVPLVGVGVACQSQCPLQADLPDLRIMSFSVLELRSIDGERGHTADTSFVITMVYSDSTVRVFLYDASRAMEAWTLLRVGNYTSSCLTQSVYMFPFDHFTLLTGGTDGHIAIWMLPELTASQSTQPSSPNRSPGQELHRRHRTRIHQNTIKTLTTLQLSAGVCLILTGGDDGAIGVTILRFSGSAAPKVAASTLLIPRAHAAAVTACDMFFRSTGSAHVYGLRAFTSSTDQRLKAWDVDVDLDGLGVERVEVRKAADVFTPVADVSSMAVLPISREHEEKTGILVCGVGMDVWTL